MKNGYATFAENFSNCCFRSRGRLAYKKAQEDKEHIRASQECDELFKAIQAKLGENDTLLGDLDDAKNYDFSLDENFVYQQGFQDCVYLLRWIGML